MYNFHYRNVLWHTGVEPYLLDIQKDGKIVDRGNSDDLLLRNNYFRDLLNMQPQ